MFLPTKRRLATDGNVLVIVGNRRQLILGIISTRAWIGRVKEGLLTPLRNSATGIFTLRIRKPDPLGKVRILLADDHRQFLTMVERLLASTCEVVGSVPDGRSLFDAARRLAPDVIVTDISMPTLNGIEASKQLNESGCAAKIIFLTVHSDADFVQACLATGAVGYVAKSRFDLDLIPAIQEALAGHIFISPTFSYPPLT